MTGQTDQVYTLTWSGYQYKDFALRGNRARVKIQTKQGRGTTGLPYKYKRFVFWVQIGQGKRANRPGSHPDVDGVIIPQDKSKTTNMLG